MSHTFGTVDSVAKEHDELDVIGSSRSSTTVIGDGTPSVEEDKYTIKLRVPRTRIASQAGESTLAVGKRVRTLSAVGHDGNSGQKKQKMQDKKAVGSPLLLSCMS
jgi:SWI/SNF-related matrix-associated actin-dependent regulator of chromatin subfamily A member 5